MEDSKIAQNTKETLLTAEEANEWLKQGGTLVHKGRVEKIRRKDNGSGPIYSLTSSYNYLVDGIFTNYSWSVYRLPEEETEEHTYKRKSLLNWRRSE